MTWSSLFTNTRCTLWMQPHVSDSWKCTKYIWIVLRQNVSPGIYKQRRSWSDCASAQSDQDLRCPQIKSFNTLECFSWGQMPEWDCASTKRRESAPFAHARRHFVLLDEASFMCQVSTSVTPFRHFIHCTYYILKVSSRKHTCIILTPLKPHLQSKFWVYRGIHYFFLFLL